MLATGAGHHRAMLAKEEGRCHPSSSQCEARRLLQQNPRPRRYVGVDAHKTMVHWCQRNLSPVAAGFQFVHHDVYSPLYSPENNLQLAEPFPVGDGEFSLVVAISVFTHLCRQQTEYYVAEVARILKPGGVAFTTWFFFDRDSFPFLQEGPFCLYTSEANFAEAVVYDRRWFIDTVRRLGLGVRSTTPPVVAGHQWTVSLEKRIPDAVDQFPLGEEGAEWVCGATSKPMATVPYSPELKEKVKGRPVDEGKRAPAEGQGTPGRPQAPPLFGALADLKLARAELEAIRRSWAWRICRAVTAPARMLQRFVQPF